MNELLCRRKSLLLILLCSLHLLTGIGATIGGLLLMIRPDGSLLHIQPGWLNHSPFQTYFIPGLILSQLLGIFSLSVFFGLLLPGHSRYKGILNIYPNMHWAWTYSLYESIIIILWILIQQVMTQYFWMQSVILLFGVLILIITLLPSVIRHFQLRIN